MTADPTHERQEATRMTLDRKLRELRLALARALPSSPRRGGCPGHG
ncbi:MAG: hypothetical protein ACXVHI_01530 [Frankiaceae bacterium]